ncbi:unnamed protein product [Boreogadus saida]
MPEEKEKQNAVDAGCAALRRTHTWTHIRAPGDTCVRIGYGRGHTAKQRSVFRVAKACRATDNHPKCWVPKY